MIIDKIENATLYAALGDRLTKGLALIQNPSLPDKAPGKYDIDGDNLFYMIHHYATKDKDEILFEAHKDYIDIQAVIEGAETIGWAPADTLEIVKPYEPDIVQCSDPDHYTELKLPKGTFAIFFPNDAHKPGCHYHQKGDVIKVVVKVKI
ncbi:MAG: YhcH/YjgK/YiaL family protein [Phycisphaerae bacterium]|nr:YhcH/YjgK/YiaL family protein [Phycisphaerae bacterium]